MKIKAMTTRKIDNKGRILIPKEMLNLLGGNGNEALSLKVVESNTKVYLKIERI